MRKRIGLLFGVEDTFPWALIDEINGRGGDVEATPIELSCLRDDASLPYDLVIDRISHQVPFYRTVMKCAAASGTIVVNNPTWWSADDKFFQVLVARAGGVAVPKSVLLPHKSHPNRTQARSFRNLRFVDWDEVFAYLGFPIFLKPIDGGGFHDIWKCDNRDRFFQAYDLTRDLCMLAQEAIDWGSYFRCFTIGRSRVRVMPYEPLAPFAERYPDNVSAADPALVDRMQRDAITLCQLLGYDMNAVEFAVRDGVPYAIDYLNCAPDAELTSIGSSHFEWVVRTMAEFAIERVAGPRHVELTGSWPNYMTR